MKEGWEYKKLKEVGLTQTGTTPSKQIKSFYGGDIPFIRPAELNIDQNGGILYESELKLTEEGALKARVIKENSVLMCCIGSVGKTGFTLRSVTCNQQINTITPYDNYNPKFVYYALISPSFQQEVTKIANSAKATLPIISKGKWEVLSFPIPSLSEQQQIVERLDAAFAKIDALKSNAQKQLDEARALFQASLKEILEPKEGWEEKKLGEICDFRSGFAFKSNRFTKIGEPIIRISDIQNEEIVDSNLVYFDPKSYTEDLSKYLIYPDDILIAMSGGTTGKIGINTSNRTYYLNQRVGVFRENKKYLNHRYLFYFLHTKSEESLRIAAGAAQPNLSTAQIKSFIVPISSLSEQQSIVDTLDSLKFKVDRLQENFDKISQECDALKQAILREIFE